LVRKQPSPILQSKKWIQKIEIREETRIGNENLRNIQIHTKNEELKELGEFVKKACERVMINR